MTVMLGIGCDRNTSLETLSEAVTRALHDANIAHSEVIGVASIDKKSDEQALLLLAQQYHWPLHFYTAAQLAAVTVPNPSETVRRYMGTPAVAEAAALLAAHANMRDLILEKLKHLGADGKNATVSIAKVMYE